MSAVVPGARRALLAPRWRPGAVPALIAAAVLLVLLVAALAPALIAPGSPTATDARAGTLPPSPEHWFGTDRSGRDVFTRVVHGTGASLGLGLGATGLALVAGGLLGTLAGLAPRRVDGVLARAVDVLMALPEFLVALLLIAILGPGTGSVLVAVALAAVPAYARVARVRTQQLARSAFVESALVLGQRPWRRVLRHVLPNLLGPLLTMAALGLGTAIVSAAGLGFLGLGATPPAPEWGVLLSEGRNLLGTAWWVAVFPGAAITASVVCASVLGRWLGGRR